MKSLVRLLVCAITLTAAISFSSEHSTASDCSGSGGSGTSVTTGVSGILLHGEQNVTPSDCGESTSAATDHPDPPRDSDLDSSCVRESITVNQDPFQFCDVPVPQGEAPVVITAGMVSSLLKRIPLPASELQVQPPGGETLVNFETNFFTEQEPFTRTVRLLGQRVELKIWPSRFRWVFGDGSELASVEAGAPYPDLEITHDYVSKGGLSPRVDTTYAAQFRVNGGAWRDVDGTVTIPGAPVQLEVRTATPVLVGYR